MNLQLLFIILSVFFQGIYMQAVSLPNGTTPQPGDTTSRPNGKEVDALNDTEKILAIQGYYKCPSTKLQYCRNSYSYCTCCGNSCRCLL